MAAEPNAELARYHWVARLLHWLIAIAVVGLIASGLYAEELVNSPFKLKIFFWHKSFGVLVLALMVLRLVWRLLATAPAHASKSKLAIKSAEYGHAGLYILLFLMPLSGWVIQSAANYPFQVFDLFALPAVVEPSKATAEIAATVHGWSSKLLIGLLLGHIAAVAVHRWVVKSDVFPRIALSRRTSFILLIALALVVWRVVGDVATPTDTASTEVVAEEIAESSKEAASEQQAMAPEWLATAESSTLGFKATYDGIEFSGVFSDFNASILFDPTNLPGSRFLVDVDVTSATTNDSTRDDALAGEDWFDYERFPLARYDARSFSMQSDGSFIAKGRLTIKEFSRPLSLIFHWQENADGSALLRVDAELSRLEFGVGTGMWTDPIVGHNVVVESLLTLNKKAL